MLQSLSYAKLMVPILANSVGTLVWPSKTAFRIQIRRSGLFSTPLGTSAATAWQSPAGNRVHGAEVGRFRLAAGDLQPRRRHWCPIGRP